MEKQLKYKDINVNYRICGEGEFVFLIHGFCEDQSMWGELVEKLSTQYTVVTPDLPGFGKSSLSQEDLTIIWMAEMMNAIMNTEKIEKCTMMGHSLGGYVSIHFAELFPHKVHALGFINSHVFEDGEEKKMNRKKSIDFIKRHTAKLFIRELINNLFSETFKLEQKELVLSLISNAQQNISDQAVIASLNAMAGRANKKNVLKKFNKPVLFLIGEIDATIPIEQSMQQVSLPSQSDIHIRKHIAHMSIYEDSMYSTNAILAFLERNRQFI